MTDSIFTTIFNFLNKPKVAIIIMLIGLIGFLIITDLTGGFSSNFVKFGPSLDDNGNYIKFIGIELNTWNRVIIVYLIIFLTCILQAYYANVIGQNLHAYVFVPGMTIPFSKFWTYLVYIIDPIIVVLLGILRIYAATTFQIQYIIPQFIGSYIIDIPFIFKWLHGRKFVG